MTISIGIFTAEPSMKNIMQATQSLNAEYTFTFFPYNSTHHLDALYKENAYKFDGLLFSGLFSYQYILSNLGVPQKPHGYLEVTDRDYYRVLLQVICRHPGMDIRRIWLDRPTIPISWEEIFGEEDILPKLSSDESEVYNIYGDDLYSALLKRYTQLWNNQEVDFIITRMTNLAQSLSAAGIPHALLLPSAATIRETILRLIQEIQSDRMVDAMSAFGILQPNQALSPQETEEFQFCLHEFNRQQGTILILREGELGYEIITTNNVLRDFTRSYSRCLLSDYLHSHCNILFSLGWGVGNDIIHAQQNAVRGLNESKRNKNHNPYLVTASGEVIGPLEQGKTMVLSTVPTAQASVLSKKLGISPSNMQKLLTVLQRRNNSQLSRNDLALYLNVTLRTANRILTKLSEIGAAQVVATEQTASAGRPMAVYELNLDKLSSL